ncbi:MAG: DUF2066 domain-containing protein [Sinobacteraceae bacterium]|nr:DUF2066 domain-containing protein [Nevskiaceae bacterium]MBV8854354.1 DUF2066 domain-containing protein [Nevskiaceae bacterium]
MARNTPRRLSLLFARRLSVLALYALACVPLCVYANRPVRVYDVEIKGAQDPAAVQDAMREVLVRATGRRESANDPAFASLVASAPNYLKGSAPGAHGGTQLAFDGTAVERAIAGVGRSVWSSQRPFTLILLYPPLARPAEDAARAELERAAAARGLPVALVPLSPLDSAGNELSQDAMMQLGQKYGADVVLVGRSDQASPSAQWAWRLYTQFSKESWSGPLAAGVDGVVDHLVAPQGGSLAQTEADARVEIDGIGGLSDYANVQRMLESVPGVRRANVSAADGAHVVFDVLIRGGSEALSHSLGNAQHLVKTEVSSARLAYQYRP